MSRDVNSRTPVRPGANRSSAFNALLAETMGPAAPPAPSPKEAEVDSWMAPGGRLRIGSDGVPIKFNLHKVAAAKAAVKRVAASAAGGEASSPPRAGAAARPTAASAPASTAESSASTTLSGSSAPAPASPSSAGAAVSAADISHGLQLIAALVGDDISELDLGCVSRQARAGGGGVWTRAGRVQSAPVRSRL